MGEEMYTYIVTFKTISKDVVCDFKWRDKIDCYSAWAMLNNNTYLFVSSEKIESITKHFADLVGNGNQCFIAKISDDVAWTGYQEGVSKWIKENKKKNK